jgi:uncharacterized protein (TIGR03643 family)
MSLKKKSKQPVTRVALSRPKTGSAEWIVWAAWADRMTFEEINAETGLSEAEVIGFMQKHQSPQTFRRWRGQGPDRVPDRVPDTSRVGQR